MDFTLAAMPFRRFTLETISKLAYTVTPAQAGVHNSAKNLDPAFAGMTTNDV
jgi:hypothetical protein